jgi:hypothetical protein
MSVPFDQKGCCGHDCMVVGFTTTYMKSVPTSTEVVSLNPAHGEMYLIQLYVIEFVSDLWQVSGYLQFFPPINLTTMI